MIPLILPKLVTVTLSQQNRNTEMMEQCPRNISGFVVFVCASQNFRHFKNYFCKLSGQLQDI